MERRHSLRPIADRASYLPPHGMRVRAHAALRALLPMTGCAPRGCGNSCARTDPTPARCASFDVNRIRRAAVALAAGIAAWVRMLAQTTGVTVATGADTIGYGG